MSHHVLNGPIWSASGPCPPSPTAVVPEKVSLQPHLPSFRCPSRPRLCPPQSLCARMSLRLEHSFQIFVFVSHVTIQLVPQMSLSERGLPKLSLSALQHTDLSCFLHSTHNYWNYFICVLVYCLSPDSHPNKNVSSIRIATLSGLQT